MNKDIEKAIKELEEKLKSMTHEERVKYMTQLGFELEETDYYNTVSKGKTKKSPANKIKKVEESDEETSEVKI